MKYAVIDIGSNSLRLLVADCEGAGYTVVDKDREVVRLADELTASGRLGDRAMNDALDVLKRFCNRAEKLGAKKTFAFATSAVRDASNREEFLKHCKLRLDINVDVLNGFEEAQIGFCGALGANGTGTVLDIGGGSTEVICGKSGAITLAASAPVGCVRAYTRYGLDKDGFTKTRKWLGECETECLVQGKECKKRRFDRILHAVKRFNMTVYAVGGTATTLSAMAAGHTRNYDPRVVQGRALTRGEIEHVAGDVARMPMELRKKVPVLQGREDTILYGAQLLLKCMEDMEAMSVHTSDSDNLEGYLKSRVLD